MLRSLAVFISSQRRFLAWHLHSLFWRTYGFALAQLQRGWAYNFSSSMAGNYPTMLSAAVLLQPPLRDFTAAMFSAAVWAYDFAARVCLFCVVTAGVWLQKVCSCESVSSVAMSAACECVDQRKVMVVLLGLADGCCAGLPCHLMLPASGIWLVIWLHLASASLLLHHRCALQLAG